MNRTSACEALQEHLCHGVDLDKFDPRPARAYPGYPCSTGETRGQGQAQSLSHHQASGGGQLQASRADVDSGRLEVRSLDGNFAKVTDGLSQSRLGSLSVVAQAVKFSTVALVLDGSQASVTTTLKGSAGLKNSLDLGGFSQSTGHSDRDATTYREFFLGLKHDAPRFILYQLHDWAAKDFTEHTNTFLARSLPHQSVKGYRRFVTGRSKVGSLTRN